MKAPIRRGTAQRLGLNLPTTCQHRIPTDRGSVCVVGLDQRPCNWCPHAKPTALLKGILDNTGATWTPNQPLTPIELTIEGTPDHWFATEIRRLQADGSLSLNDQRRSWWQRLFGIGRRR
jgi:hypothetical protein